MIHDLQTQAIPSVGVFVACAKAQLAAPRYLVLVFSQRAVSAVANGIVKPGVDVGRDKYIGGLPLRLGGFKEQLGQRSRYVVIAKLMWQKALAFFGLKTNGWCGFLMPSL